MATVKWAPGVTVGMDPDAELDYSLDFTKWLQGGALVSVVATATGCTVSVATFVGSVAKYRVSDVIAEASVTLRVTTADGQVDDFTINFVAQSK